jgi:putative inorganic carbon (hco3(-)) transporter
MYLVKFLLIGAIFCFTFGEFLHFPFGAPGAVYVSDILLGLCGTFFVIWQVIQHKKVNQIYKEIPTTYKYLLAFMLVGLLSLIVSSWYFDLADIMRGSVYLIRFFVYSLTFVITYFLVKEKYLHQLSLYSLFISIGILLGIFGMIQIILFPNFDYLTQFGFDPHQYRLASTFLDPNFTGVYLVLTFSLALQQIFQKDRSRLDWLILIFLLLCIILTYSRSAYLMLGIFVIMISIFKKQTLLIGLMITVLLCSLLIPRIRERIIGGFTLDASASERVSSWENSLKVVQKNPIIGVGFNNYRAAQEELNLFKVTSPDGGHAGSGVDSSYLLVLATTGVIGFIAFILFWVQSIWFLFRKRTQEAVFLATALIALTVATQFINALFFPPIMLWYFVLMGTTYASQD